MFCIRKVFRRLGLCGAFLACLGSFPCAAGALDQSLRVISR